MKLSQIASAKINLTLEVLGKRSDGYHNILSVLQCINLYDTLTFTSADEIEFTCCVAGLASEDNLVVRAARALKTATGYKGGAAIHLEKQIPLAAGLGGGSSDAAATLRGLIELWGLKGFPFHRLVQIATQMGMDVPFFLYDGTALVQGRGEVVTPLPPLSPTWFVLLHPPIDVASKTARMYGSLPPTSYTLGTTTLRLVDTIHRAQPIEEALLYNVFESVADRVFTDLQPIRQRFEQICGMTVHMSGAGPTLFCLAKDHGDSERLRDKLRAEGFEAYSCKSVAPK